MKAISYFFFYTYIGTVILAGFEGAFINPVYDHKLLFHLDVNSLPEYSRINLLSQYRFLRALELGFGLFALIFTRQIFSESKYNLLFLSVMGMGVLARIFSVFLDGSPSFAAYVFFVWEFIGVIFIFFYTRKNIHSHA